jgi:phosphoglycolate phosphatase
MVRLPNCVVFDLDGTILDSLPGIEASVRVAFAACGQAAPTGGLREFIGPPIRTIIARAGKITDEATLDALESAFRSDYDREGWQRTICFPEAAHVLRIMHQHRHRLFVASNKPQQVSLKILEKEQIVDAFEAIVTRDSRFPLYECKEEMIATLLAERCIAAENSVMVGDTMEDAKAAAAVGIGFIYMTHGYGMVDTASAPVACKLDKFSQFLPLIAEELVSD